eukprot:scaffold651_cov252-Pinguiococcus_pyrenoidosus.AAC.9
MPTTTYSQRVDGLFRRSGAVHIINVSELRENLVEVHLEADKLASGRVVHDRVDLRMRPVVVLVLHGLQPPLLDGGRLEEVDALLDDVELD